MLSKEHMELHGGHPTKPSLNYTTMQPGYSFNHVCVVVSATLRESSRLDIYPLTPVWDISLPLEQTLIRRVQRILVSLPEETGNVE